MMNRFQPRRGLSFCMAVVMLFSLTVPAVAADTATTITLNETNLEMVTTTTDGTNKKELTAIVKEGETEVSSPEVTWTSDKPQIANVEVTGIGKKTATVTALAEGEAVITASYTTDDKETPADVSDDTVITATCTVKVTVPVDGISVQPTKESIEVGDEYPLDVQVTPGNASNKAIEWKITNKGDALEEPVVSVSAVGVVTGLRPGVVDITGITKDGGLQATSEMTVNGIYLNEHKIELFAGKNKTVYPTCFGTKAKDYEDSLQWVSSNSAIASVKNGKITATAVGTATITVYAGTYKDTVEVTVLENTQTVVKADAVAEANTPYAFYQKLADDIQAIALKDFNSKLLYMNNLSVATDAGTLYYGYASPDAPGHGVGGVEKYVYLNPTGDQMGFTEVTLVPKADFSGTLEVTYTGHCENGRSFSGVIRIEVENHGDVAYNTAEERALPFAGEDFSVICEQRTGKSLRYVTFKQPAETKGTLYYNYSETGQFSPKVSEGTKYYVSGGTTLLDNITFVPAEGFTGTVSIAYVGTNSGNISYPGIVTIYVFPEDSTGLGANVNYSTAPSAPLTFETADFSEACYDATSSTLNYIYLTLPDPSQGTLYYNYKSSVNYGSRVSASTRYFRSSSSEPEIEKITFVPAGDFTGSVTIPYTGYAASGGRYEGNIIIRVSGDPGLVTYSTSSGRAVDFEGLDFNEVCQISNGKAMDDVTFELPAASAGTLYYRYGTNRSAKVKVTDDFTRSELDDVTFVPKSGFSGVVSIPFSGYDTAGSRFSGTVEILVSSAAGDDTIYYNTYSDGTVTMDPADFNEVSRFMTDDNLDYVRFTLPASKYGTLYYQYDEDKKNNTKVGTSYSYYRTPEKTSERDLAEVTFKAPETYTGTVTIQYTGRSTGGESFEGTIEITVGKPVVSAIYYGGTSLPVHFSLRDFRDACQNALKKELSYIQFDAMPSAACGKLVLDYYGSSGGTAASASTRYRASGSPAIDELSFIPKAGYQGTLTLSYTAADTADNTVDGTVRITINNSSLTPSFVDLSGHKWAIPSIEFLHDAGVVNGYGNGIYGPARATNRGDFVLMVCRIFDFDLTSGSSFPDVPASSIYAQAAATAKALGIVNGIDGRFEASTPISRQQAVVMLERAMQAAGWSVRTGSLALLSHYHDGSQVAGYAKQAMASMIQMGTISGDTKGYLHPADNMTRAEIASMLHRMLTL